jgi:cytochrome o ubiquinol oxidase operon protein cyoD
MSHSYSENHIITAGTGKKTLKSYLVGFVLCLILTLASFAVAGKPLLNTVQSYIVLGVLAVAQLFVQVICFLRLNTSKEGRWNVMSFLFTILIILVIVGGSFWIMWNLNYNMMHY